MLRITMEDLARRVDDLLAMVEAGQTIMLPRGGTDIVMLSPVEHAEPAWPGR